MDKLLRTILGDARLYKTLYKLIYYIKICVVPSPPVNNW
jgi:hypothetical protein